MAVNPATVMAALSAAQTAYSVGKQYAPAVKKVANMVFHKGRARSAKNYLRKLKTKKGMRKFIRKDVAKALKYVGKHSKDVEGLARDTKGGLKALGMDPKYAELVESMARHSGEKASSYHEMIEHLNKRTKNPLKSYKAMMSLY